MVQSETHLSRAGRGYQPRWSLLSRRVLGHRPKSHLLPALPEEVRGLRPKGGKTKVHCRFPEPRKD